MELLSRPAQDIYFFLANIPNAGEKTYILHKA